MHDTLMENIPILYMLHEIKHACTLTLEHVGNMHVGSHVGP